MSNNLTVNNRAIKPTAEDAAFMAQALRLAERGWLTTMPNPRVGCLLVRDGEVIAQGWHYRAGEAHAEVHALRQAGEQARGATAYVTLEPCSHTGKTGPCCEALVAAGVARVVFAMEDPNPSVAGRGIEHLRQAGIAVSGPLLEDDARALNPGFLKRMERGLPWVRCKLAMSLDGRTAMADGRSKWVTSRKSREDVQQLRAASCAIISGIDTVLLDNAALTVRAADLRVDNAMDAAEKQPLRVILDSRLRLTRDAEILRQATPIWLVHNGEPDNAQRLHDWPAHLQVIALPAADGRIDLLALLKALAQQQCNEVLVEAGATLAGSFLRRGLLDEVIVYMAPKLLGSSARPLFDLPLDTMSAALPLKIRDIRAVGEDWRITAVPDMEH